MIRSTLHIYRKNIWNVFAVTGIVALGVLVALIVALPNIYNLLNYNVAKIISSASSIPESGFDVTAFIESLNRQFTSLNWRDPISSIQSLLDSKEIIHLLTKALMDSGFQKEVLGGLTDTIAVCADNVVAGMKEQLIFMLTCIGVSTIIAFILPRIVIQLHVARLGKDHKDKEYKQKVKSFVSLFFLNLLTVALVYTLVILCLLSTMNILEFILSMIVIAILLMVLTFLWPIICYKDKKTKFTTLFNFKTFGLYLLCSLMVLGISGVIFTICFFISDVIGIVIVLPLIFISNIIMENIVLTYVTNYYEIKRKNKMKRDRLKKKKAKKVKVALN